MLSSVAHAFTREFANNHRWPAPESAHSSPWARLDGFRLNAPVADTIRLLYRGEHLNVAREGPEVVFGPTVVDGEKIIIFDHGEAHEFTLDTGEVEGGEAAAGDGAILSPMPGKIVSVAAKTGARLKKGDPILVLEAMKMEHTLTAPFDGRVAELNAKPGAQVSEGVLLAKLEAA
jgi:acetyl/propionyl-CoA carboxylase alpha subunit